MISLTQNDLDLCNHSGSYDSDDPERPWFLVTFFNLTESSVGPKWKIKSQYTKFFHSNVERVLVGPNKKYLNRVSHFEVFNLFKWCLQMDVLISDNYINECIIYVII